MYGTTTRKKERDMQNETETEFFKNIAFANQGSTCVMLTDRDINEVFGYVAILANVTNHDICIYVHVHGYKHIQYLNFLRTLVTNAPMDLCTRVVRGEENQNLDLQVHDDSTIDVIVVAFTDTSRSLDVLPFAWKKLKPNGSIIFKGFPLNEQEKLRQTFVDTVKGVPPSICINIFAVENTRDVFYIKKPCY